MNQVLYKTPRFGLGQEVAMKLADDRGQWFKYGGVVCGVEINKPGYPAGWVYHIDWIELPEGDKIEAPYRDTVHETELMLYSWEWLENALNFASHFPEHWQRSKRLNAYLQLVMFIAIASRWLILYLFLNHCWLQAPAEKKALRERRREANRSLGNP
jgi:hypothetical protein